jgi:hypothetical protein
MFSSSSEVSSAEDVSPFQEGVASCSECWMGRKGGGVMGLGSMALYPGKMGRGASNGVGGVGIG